MKSALVFLVFSGWASAQEFPLTSMHVGAGAVTATYGPPLPARVVINAPYSAELRVPNAQAAIARFARDSRGRVRTELAQNVGFWIVAVFDPVVGVAYLLDEDHKVAHRMRLPAAGASAPSQDNLDIDVVRGFKMSRLTRTEPDPALFRPPTGYNIVDEATPFRMTVGLK